MKARTLAPSAAQLFAAELFGGKSRASGWTVITRAG
jgi:hypothetical protein